MILEHLTSNSNAYVNFILYGCSEIFPKFNVYKELSCPCKKRWFWQFTLSKYLFLYSL